ncbi:uncharacterized protein F5147DRAFT_769935 [Suillus discolor]|uniref:Uncharacterized protein n=1 Tax=Suillus discolor TaxID=1912936 RepID=A0A9P7FED9_9AGAM|nr:uncharacterized protein F5147DRAFT_769935 [Suillus discolor]KAG2114618.1 hypothetical protein F5147DRAFT_769935 [Suillus discolor]
MKPPSLLDNNKLVTAYSHVLKAITTLLTRAGVFLISLGIDGHIVSRGIASLADSLKELQGIVVMIEEWVDHAISSQKSENNTQANPVESGQKEEDVVVLPRTPPRSTHMNQSTCLRPDPTTPSPTAPYGVSIPWSAFPQSSPQTTSLFCRGIQHTPLSIQNAPALFNHMRAIPTPQTPARTIGLFGSPMTSNVMTPLAYGRHLSSIDTPRQIPPLFWRPAPKAHAIKLMVPDSARHRKKAGKENEEVAVASASSKSIPSLLG